MAFRMGSGLIRSQRRAAAGLLSRLPLVAVPCAARSFAGSSYDFETKVFEKVSVTMAGEEEGIVVGGRDKFREFAGAPDHLPRPLDVFTLCPLAPWAGCVSPLDSFPSRCLCRPAA